MRRWHWLVMVGALFLLAACGPAQSSVPFYDLVGQPQRYNQQEVTVLGFYYQKDSEQILVVGVRTDDGFQNPVPLGDAIWVEGMPPAVVDKLNTAAGATYGMVQVSGRFETGGSFGPEGKYSSRLVITDPSRAVALEAAQMKEEWVPADLNIPGAVSLADLLANPEQYRGITVTLAAYYYWTPRTFVLAEGIRSLDGVHNAVPIGKQIWVDGFPPDVSGELHVLPETRAPDEPPTNVHGLVKVTGRFEIGMYGPDQEHRTYPYRLNMKNGSAEAIKR